MLSLDRLELVTLTRFEVYGPHKGWLPLVSDLETRKHQVVLVDTREENLFLAEVEVLGHLILRENFDASP